MERELLMRLQSCKMFFFVSLLRLEVGEVAIFNPISAFVDSFDVFY